MAEHQYSLDPAKLFREFARDGFWLRDPVNDTIGLYRSFAVGSCLEPLIVAGDEIFIDLSARPQHSDLVLFEWPPEIVAQWRASARSTEWVQRWGQHDMTRGLKLLWEFPRDVPDWVPTETFLLTNEDMSKVSAHKLLGVVRAVVRSGVLLSTLGLAACDNVAPYAAPGAEIPVACASIDPNAATDFGSAFSASGSQNSFTYSGPPTTIDTTILTLNYTNNTGSTQTLELFASCRFTVSGAGGGWLVAPRVTGTYPQSAVVGRTAATDEQYAYTGSATIAAGATMTLTLSAEFKNGGTGSNALVFAYTDAAIKYNILKR
jgi:hypothetical protein